MYVCQVVGVVRERSIAVTVRPVSIYPGGSAEAIVYVHGSGFRVVLSATPSDNCVEVVGIDPVNGRTPLQVRIARPWYLLNFSVCYGYCMPRCLCVEYA